MFDIVACECKFLRIFVGYRITEGFEQVKRKKPPPKGGFFSENINTWPESILSADYINNLRFAPALDSYHGKPVELASSGCMV